MNKSDTDFEEQAYDFIAMAEEAEKQMTEMFKDLPDRLCRAVEKIMSNAGKTSELANAAGALNKAIAGTQRNLRRIYLTAVALMLLVPLAELTVLYFQTSSLRQENAGLRASIVGLEKMAAALEQGDSKGFELVEYPDGTLGVILPPGRQLSHTGTVGNGRGAVVVK